MKKFIKVCVCTIWFLAALFLSSIFFNRGNTDMTAAMMPAKYPLLSINLGGHKVNCLRPYTKEQQLSYMRENITPLSEGRGLSISVDTYENEISSIIYEIRDLSGERLVEQTELENLITREDKITATFSVKNLIEENREYSLIFRVKLVDGTQLSYYTRVIQAYDYMAQEKINFAFDFSDKTFLKDESSEELVTYLESDNTGDNSTYHNVDIHSSYQQVIWDELNVKRVTEPIATITELSTQTASITLRYVINVPEGRKECLYSVCEKFRIRYGSERIYLLAYNRTMDKLIHTAENTIFGDTLMLGIVDENLQMVESSDGNQVAFVNCGTLYAYNSVSQSLAKVYGFYDEDNLDERTLNSQHDIKILNVDETGNVCYMVYGYMNRGKHEGEVGIDIYNYNGSFNTTEEIMFLPYTKTYALLKANLERLTYLSKNNDFYFYLDGTIYRISLSSKEQEVIVANLTEQMFKTSENHLMLVWQEGNECYDAMKLNWMNLNTKETGDILSGKDARILPLGFMGEDLIYGLANTSDIHMNEFGQLVFPMFTLRIRNNRGEVLKQYEQEGLYVVDCVINENMLSMRRIQKSEDGLSFEEASSDTILNNKAPEVGKNSIETVVTQNLKRIVQIKTKSKAGEKTVKGLFPKEVLFEGDRSIVLNQPEKQKEYYYVYSQGEVLEITSNPAEAINLADENFGVVVDDAGDYIWIKGNRLVKNQIMAITAQKESDTSSALGVCLDSILNFCGITKSTQTMLNAGRAPAEILQSNLPSSNVLDLTGCSLNAVLYYPNRELPVLVMMEDGTAMLIIGYNELNTVVMDPVEGRVYKIGMNDSTELFKKNGNRYITYLPK